MGQRPFEMEVAKALHMEYPALLPEAPEDPEAIRNCEKFREEMRQRNPLKNSIGSAE